jgi:alpha-N-arabinofuranosidase
LTTLFFVATRDVSSGTMILKIVNTADVPQPVRISVKGVPSIAPEGECIVLAGSRPMDTNSIKEPTKIVPTTSRVGGLSTDLTRTFPAYSVTILKLKAN